MLLDGILYGGLLALIGWLLYILLTRRRAYRAELGAVARRFEEMRKTLESVEASSKEAITQEKWRTIAGLLQKYNAGDSSFLNVIASVNEKKELRFVFDLAHRRIYEAAIAETDPAMIVNAIGKGKGIRLFERMLADPAGLFGTPKQEEEDGAAEV